MALVVPSQTIKKFSQAQGKEAIIEGVGDLSNITVMQNMVLVATYIRPDQTSGGIHLPDSVLEEDIYQGKVGLVLKMGPAAFEDGDEPRFYGLRANVHDWVVYRVGDSWDLTLRQVPCRLIRDDNIRLIISDPKDVF